MGSENADLPSFIVFSTGKKGPSGGNSNWGAGFLPSVHNGTIFRTSGDPVLFLSNPPGVDSQIQRDSLDTLRTLNEQHLGAMNDPEIATRINSFEMAYRMQSSAPELMDLSKESPQTLEMYGAEPGKASFANSCLLARRMVERGVRFVQIFHEAWDQHGTLVKDLTKNCHDTDRSLRRVDQGPQAAPVSSEDTLIIWGGEFRPYADGPGRQRWPRPPPPTASAIGWPAAARSKAASPSAKSDVIRLQPHPR